MKSIYGWPASDIQNRLRLDASVVTESELWKFEWIFEDERLIFDCRHAKDELELMDCKEFPTNRLEVKTYGWHKNGNSN